MADGNQGCSKLIEVILTWIWSGQELSQLGALEGLWLGENQLTGSLPKELGQLKQLEIMCLEHNQLAGAGVFEKFFLRKKSVNLVFSPDPLQYLQSLVKDFNTAWHCSTPSTGEIPEMFEQLRKIELLQLEHNQLSGEIPRSIWCLGDKISFICLEFEVEQFYLI